MTVVRNVSNSDRSPSMPLETNPSSPPNLNPLLNTLTERRSGNRLVDMITAFRRDTEGDLRRTFEQQERQAEAEARHAQEVHDQEEHDQDVHNQQLTQERLAREAHEQELHEQELHEQTIHGQTPAPVVQPTLNT